MKTKAPVVANTDCQLNETAKDSSDILEPNIGVPPHQLTTPNFDARWVQQLENMLHNGILDNSQKTSQDDLPSALRGLMMDIIRPDIKVTTVTPLNSPKKVESESKERYIDPNYLQIDQDDHRMQSH